jgi:tRNA threonylcarbamoyladenosine biosynthesis protein TsaE
MNQTVIPVTTLSDFTEAMQSLFMMIKNNHPAGRALFLCLHGDLGAGKTTATQTIGKLLGITETIQSPTFVIKKIYAISNDVRYTNLIHMDAYRLADEPYNPLFGITPDSLQSDNIIIIEWPEYIASVIPPDAYHIFITHTAEGRLIAYQENV